MFLLARRLLRVALADGGVVLDGWSNFIFCGKPAA
jgi:hypothetical protein